MDIGLIIGLLLASALLLLGAVALWALTSRRGRDDDSREGEAPVDDSRRTVAIVVNPTKFSDMDRLRQRLDRIADLHGWRVRWWETTAEDPGTGQTRDALSADVDLVCALGGDGTVRSVAAALLDTEVPMGLLPGGTGNLLARNLDLPIESLDGCFVAALTGTERRIDVGRLAVSPDATQEQPKDYYFLVMAGLGFDASVMAQAPEKLKATLGWGAYVVSGLAQLDGPRFVADVAVDQRKPTRRRVRSIVIGNVGRIQGGVELLPDAEADDASLDAVLLAPEGLAGWARVAVRILTKRRRGDRQVEHVQCRSMTITLPEGAQEMQLDGDVIGPAWTVTAGVLPGALLVKVPGRGSNTPDTPESEQADRTEVDRAERERGVRDAAGA